MRATSVGKRRKRTSEVRSDQMNIDGEREEEEDAGREKKRVKLAVGPVGKGKGWAVSSDGEEKERSRKSSVTGKGKSKRKQADHAEDGDAIVEHSSHPLIIHLLQMHLHVGAESEQSSTAPLPRYHPYMRLHSHHHSLLPHYILLLRPHPQGQLQ